TPRLTCASLALLLSLPVLADDWTQYRGPRGTGISSESLADVPWSSAPNQQWKVPTNLGFSSFSIAGDRVFTLVAGEEGGTKLEFCLALDAKTGNESWRRALNPREYRGGGDAGASGNRGGDGPRSTPACDGRHVYVYDAEMSLHCLRANDGELVWKRDVLKEFDGRNIEWKNASSPVLQDGIVYVGGGGQDESFLAFDALTGDLKWKTGDETITHATPQIAEINGVDQIVYFVQSGLVSLRLSDGKEIWRTQYPFSVSSAASPVISDDLVYCSAGYGVGAGLFKITEQNEVQDVWAMPNELMNHWSTPVVHDGHLYGIYEFKKYGKAPLQCVDLATGEILWSQRNFGPGNCILVGDKLVVLSDAGEVVIVKAQPDEYKEIARADVLEGKCWSTPAFSDGRIYVRSTTEAACLDLNSL
ncbi:MAG: PQQ-binding-like beta-propeller repeat protein, partial [Planctomycetota bacterium]